MGARARLRWAKIKASSLGKACIRQQQVPRRRLETSQMDRHEPRPTGARASELGSPEASRASVNDGL